MVSQFHVVTWDKMVSDTVYAVALIGPFSSSSSSSSMLQQSDLMTEWWENIISWWLSSFNSKMSPAQLKAGWMFWTPRPHDGLQMKYFWKLSILNPLLNQNLEEEGAEDPGDRHEDCNERSDLDVGQHSARRQFFFFHWISNFYVKPGRKKTNASAQGGDGGHAHLMW